MTDITPGALGLDGSLLEIIVCPQCHGALDARTPLTFADDPGVGGELACQGECGLVYPVRDSIPVLLVDEARS